LNFSSFKFYLLKYRDASMIMGSSFLTEPVPSFPNLKRFIFEHVVYYYGFLRSYIFDVKLLD